MKMRRIRIKHHEIWKRGRLGFFMSCFCFLFVMGFLFRFWGSLAKSIGFQVHFQLYSLGIREVYMSLKGGIQTAMLKEAYKDDQLIDRDPLLES